NDLSMTTLRPLGPSVTLTALARMLTPRTILSRASVENFTSLAAITGAPYVGLEKIAREISPLRDHAHDVGFFHDQQVLAVELDLGAGPLAEQDAVADLDVEGDDLAVFVTGAGTHGLDDALGR